MPARLAVRPDFHLPADDIEAGFAHPPAIFAQPGKCTAHQPLLLGKIHGQLRRTKACAPAGFYLDEDDTSAASSDQVDLDAPDSDVAIRDAISFVLEVERGSPLPFGAQGKVRAPGSVLVKWASWA